MPRSAIPLRIAPSRGAPRRCLSRHAARAPWSGRAGGQLRGAGRGDPRLWRIASAVCSASNLSASAPRVDASTLGSRALRVRFAMSRVASVAALT